MAANRCLNSFENHRINRIEKYFQYPPSVEGGRVTPDSQLPETLHDKHGKTYPGTPSGTVWSHATQGSGTYTASIIEDIQIKAELGRYRIRGFGTLRPRTWTTFDDLTFIPCGLTRIPLEGYRESCSTRTVLGTRYAEKPVEVDIPIMVTGMSYGALSYNA